MNDKKRISASIGTKIYYFVLAALAIFLIVVGIRQGWI